MPIGHRQRRVRHPDGRQHAPAVGHRRAEARTSCRASSPARTVWCQGYSEPNAGSDLGNLGCRAVLDGDEWVINGQKIWTSAGHLANWIFVLARTDPDAPEAQGHHVPARARWTSPASRSGPIKMITGRVASSTRCSSPTPACPKDNVVGEVNGGWAVAMTLLGYERGEAAATFPIMFRAELDRLVALAREHGPHRRPVDPPAPGLVPLARSRSCASSACARSPVPARRASRARRGDLQALLERVPPHGHRAGGRHPRRPTAMVPSGRWPTSRVPDRRARARPTTARRGSARSYNARAGTIYAGTSQVQRNIIGEMVLGLPKEPRPPAPSTWRERPEDRRRGRRLKTRTN